MPPNPNLPAFEKFGRTINPSEDPSRTKGLRTRFAAQAKRRWQPSKRYVRETVINQDVFGLDSEVNQFQTDSQRIDEWMIALKRVEEESILELTRGSIPWITPFIREGFVKGMLRGNKDLRALARGQRRERAKRIKQSPASETPVSDFAEAEVRRARNALVTNQTAEDIFIAPTLDPDNIQDALQAGERARLFGLEVGSTWQGITGVTAQVNTQLAAVIADGIASRATPRQLAKDINDRIEKVGVTRSQMIARTEAVQANNKGAVAEFAEAEALTGFDVLVQWETALDSRVRDTHIVRHGKVYTRSEYLTLIGEPNCLLPDSMVFSPSKLERVFKRRYYGRVIKIKTASGNELTCTPNHPILTRNGPVPVESINVGDHVLCSTVADSPEAVSENEDHVKASIEDIASAFALRANRATTSCSALNFHGDAAEHEVAVVWTDRELMGTVHAVGLQKRSKFSLRGPYLRIKLAANRTKATIRIAAFHASNSIVSRFNLAAAFVLRHAGPFDALSVAGTSWSDPTVFQNGVDSLSPDSELFADFVGAEPFCEEITGAFFVDEVDHASDRRETSNTDSPSDDLMSDPVFVSEVLQGAPFGEVFADEIVSIDVSMYDGHVYNLQTRVGTFIAQNILSNNCRCAGLPYIPAIEGGVDPASGRAARDLTPKGAVGPAKKARKKLGLPKGQVGKPVKRRAK